MFERRSDPNRVAFSIARVFAGISFLRYHRYPSQKMLRALVCGRQSGWVAFQVCEKSDTTFFERNAEVCNVKPNRNLRCVQYHIDAGFVFELVEDLRRITPTL